MVQALAFAELLAGGVLALAGYKGYTVSDIVTGVAGPARGLSSNSTGEPSGNGSASSATASSSAEPAPNTGVAPPPVNTKGAGFTAASSADYTRGHLPQIAVALGKLGTSMGIKLHGISGYRTPAHSVQVGGFANDPHTRGEASDTEGAQTIPKAILNKFGLERPFPGSAEANHIQLLHSVNANGGY